ncbi:UNVERIFIED_CONTAM: hypothetical protein Slati_1440200 [Sesamum latifolium]|uniref:Uncharacterized protein n=1 Tax=Sesamum latifolium TaxID=2727402 RepID=A0AAW2X4Y0_9LAMI
MCMSFEYMFLRMMIPGPSNLKYLIDVYSEPMIKKLLQLWHVGVRTYDNATDIMRAALMWTVNDLPAYKMASGWNTVCIMRCPVCMDDTWAFHLQHGRKAFYLTATDSFYLMTIPTEGTRKPSQRVVWNISDHKWTKKSIFWDLPNWATHLIRYNLDIMHIEKNMFDNLFNTVMDIKEKKDNLNARNDLKIICNRLELNGY